MLMNVHPLLGPDLLHALASMGHGDHIAIVDANYPAAAKAKRLIRADGHGLIDVLEAIMTVLPVEMAAMPNTQRPIHDTLKSRLPDIKALGDDEFYGLANGAYAMVATSAPELYGNVVLTKAAVGH